MTYSSELFRMFATLPAASVETICMPRNALEGSPIGFLSLVLGYAPLCDDFSYFVVEHSNHTIFVEEGGDFDLYDQDYDDRNSTESAVLDALFSLKRSSRGVTRSWVLLDPWRRRMDLRVAQLTRRIGTWQR